MWKACSKGRGKRKRRGIRDRRREMDKRRRKGEGAEGGRVESRRM